MTNREGEAPCLSPNRGPRASCLLSFCLSLSFSEEKLHSEDRLPFHLLPAAPPRSASRHHDVDEKEASGIDSWNCPRELMDEVVLGLVCLSVCPGRHGLLFHHLTPVCWFKGLSQYCVMPFFPKISLIRHAFFEATHSVLTKSTAIGFRGNPGSRYLLGSTIEGRVASPPPITSSLHQL